MHKYVNELKIISEQNTFKRRILRKCATPAEKNLWYWIRKSLPRYKWRRQHSLGFYIADFYCHEERLVIEIDGHHHDIGKQKEYDAIRTKLFNDFIIRVIRFHNEDIINNLSDVIKQIEFALNKKA